MLLYDRKELYEAVDVNNNGNSRECIICHF